jgi:hypothetical protein
MATATKRKLAPADSLKREIQAALTDELASERHRTGHGRYDGFAYPAAEAYFHLAGGRCLSRVSDFRRDLKVIQQSSCDGSTGLAVRSAMFGTSPFHPKGLHKGKGRHHEDANRRRGFLTSSMNTSAARGSHLLRGAKARAVSGASVKATAVFSYVTPAPRQP